MQCARFGVRRRLLYLTMATTRADTPGAPVAELVDATDLKSVGRKAMPVRFRPGAPPSHADDMLTVQGVHLWRGDRHVLARRELRRPARPMRAAHRQERRRQDHAACAPSPDCSIPRKGRCSGAARRRARGAMNSMPSSPISGMSRRSRVILSARENLQHSDRHSPRRHRRRNRRRARAHRRHVASPIARRACCRRARSAAWRWPGVLLANAVLWLLDEPTTNLDADGQQLVARTRSASSWRATGSVVAAVHHSLPLPAEQLVADRARPT